MATSRSSAALRSVSSISSRALSQAWFSIPGGRGSDLANLRYASASKGRNRMSFLLASWPPGPRKPPSPFGKKTKRPPRGSRSCNSPMYERRKPRCVRRLKLPGSRPISGFPFGEGLLQEMNRHFHAIIREGSSRTGAIPESVLERPVVAVHVVLECLAPKEIVIDSGDSNRLHDFYTAFLRPIA